MALPDALAFAVLAYLLGHSNGVIHGDYLRRKRRR